MSIEEVEAAIKTMAAEITTLVQQFELSTGVNIHSLAVERPSTNAPATVRVRTRLQVDH